MSNGQRYGYGRNMPQGRGFYNPNMPGPDWAGGTSRIRDMIMQILQMKQMKKQGEWERQQAGEKAERERRKESFEKYKFMFPQEKEVKRTALDYDVEYADFMAKTYPETWTPEYKAKYLAEGKGKDVVSPISPLSATRVAKFAKIPIDKFKTLPPGEQNAWQGKYLDFYTREEGKVPKDPEEAYKKDEAAITAKYHAKRLSAFTKARERQADPSALMWAKLDMLDIKDVEAAFKPIMDEINRVEQMEINQLRARHGKPPLEVEEYMNANPGVTLKEAIDLWRKFQTVKR